MKKLKVAINGAGRIGRAFYKIAREDKEINVVAMNDLGDIRNIAYLLKFDSVYGQSDFNIDISEDGSTLHIDGDEVKFFSEPDASKLPWGELDVDVVVESTGFYTSYEKARSHIDAGAKRVVVSAPMKDDPVPGVEGATILLGVNEDKFKTCQITSNASCTTNATSPALAILDEEIGVEKAILNTIHSYTSSQNLVDGPRQKDFRAGRAGAQNIIPSTTGAAIAVEKALDSMKGKFDGISVRVPTIVGSLVDLTMVMRRDTTVDEVNEILTKATETDRWNDIFEVTREPVVSSDMKGAVHASIADLEFTRVVDGNLVKVMCWYDNEMGYTNTLVKHVKKLGQNI